MHLVLKFFVLNLMFVALEVLVALLGGVLALWPVHQAWLECLVVANRGSLILLFPSAFVVVVTTTAVITILPLVVVVILLVALPAVRIITSVTLFSLLAFANTTKPLRCRNGLVVLANANNKSAVLRVHGWPDERLFLALSDLPRTPPPLPKSATLANCKYCAEKYYAEACLYCGSAGNETQSRKSNPIPHCYQRTVFTTKPTKPL